MNIQEIIAANTAEDGTVDYEAVNAEVAKLTVSREEYEAKETEARGAYAKAKAKYNKGGQGAQTPPSGNNGELVGNQQGNSANNEALEAITKLTEQVENLQGQIAESNNKTAISQWEADAIAKGVPEETVSNLVKVSGGSLENLKAMDIDTFIAPNQQSFGAKRAPSAAELKTKKEAAMADFKNLL